MALGDVGNGVAASDSRTGSGYLLWSEESVHSRFSPSPHRDNADHLIAVVWDGAQWLVDNNRVTLVPFVPASTDCLVAQVDFGADTVTSLEGTSAVVNGIDSGYVTGDLAVVANQWNGNANNGEFGVSGTQIG